MIYLQVSQFFLSAIGSVPFSAYRSGRGGLFRGQNRPDDGSVNDIQFLDVGLAGVAVCHQTIVNFATDEAFEQQDEVLDWRAQIDDGYNLEEVSEINEVFDS